MSMGARVTATVILPHFLLAGLSKRAHPPVLDLRGTDERTKFLDQRRSLVRLSDKATVRRKLGWLKPHVAQNKQYLDWRPTVAHRMGQFQPVHAAGHVNVREKQSDIGTRFQQDNRFVRIPGLDRNEPRFLYDFDGKHPQQRFILHDKDNWRFAGWCAYQCKTLSAPMYLIPEALAGASASPDQCFAVRTQCAFKSGLRVSLASCLRSDAKRFELEFVIVFRIGHGLSPSGVVARRCFACRWSMPHNKSNRCWTGWSFSGTG